VGGMFLLAAASTWLLRSWKINQIEIKAAREREVDSPDASQIAAEHNFWLTPRSLLWLGRV